MDAVVFRWIARWAVLALCLSGGPVHAAAAATAELTLHLNGGALAMWRLTLDAPDLTSAHGTDYRNAVLSLAPVAGRAQRWEATVDITLRGANGSIHVTRLSAQMLGSTAGILFGDGTQTLLYGQMPHRLPVTEGGDWRNLDLRVAPALARALGQPALDGALLGAADLRWSAARLPPAPSFAAFARLPVAQGQASCRNTLVDPSPATPADLALADISALFAMRCAGCTADSTDGQVVVAPNAELLNVGQADIPWVSKFGSDFAPYYDQHPFLVWNLYREDADGRFVQIGASGLKHAFYAQNDNCDCTGDIFLYRGCSDIYSAFTNDSNDDLGPRAEVIPARGLWARCGSIYDANCDGSFDPGSGVGGAYMQRLIADEAELLPALNPQARWWIEAWYVVRDDAQLRNSLGHRQVVPTKADGAWTFPAAAALQVGPALERWVAPGAASHVARVSELRTSDGRLQLAARVTALPEGRFRYDYVLLNLDYARVSTSGAVPNLRIESEHGALGLALPRLATASATDLLFLDGNTFASDDWPLAVAADGVAWTATPTNSLRWGRSIAFSLTSDAGPATAQASIALASGSTARVVTLVPGVAGYVFGDSLEN